MTYVVALIPDLLFGSNVLGSLRAAGIDVELVAERDLRGSGPMDPGLAGRGAATGDLAGRSPGRRVAEADVLIVDLTGDLDGASLVEGLAADGVLAGVKTLGFYSHVDVAARERAQQAGFDLIVPRSRMAREGAGLVQRLLDG